MKKLQFCFHLAIGIILSLTFFSSCNSTKSDPNEVTINGTVANPVGDSVFIRILPVFGWDYTTHSAALNDEGAFSMKFRIDKAVPGQFYDGNEVSPMFLSPGDNLFLSLDTKEFDESISYTGEGAIENNFLAKGFMKFNDPPPSFWALSDSLSADDFEKECSNYKSDQLDFLNEYSDQNKAKEDFIKFQETEIHFQFANNLFYFFRRNRDRKLQPDTINIPRNFYTLFEEAQNYPEPCQRSQQYNGYLGNFETYIYYSAKIKLKSSKESDSLLFADIDKKLSGLGKEKAVANKFYRALASYKIDFFEENREIFNTTVKHQELVDIVNNKYSLVKEELSRPLPETAILKDLNDEEYSDISFQDIVDQYKGMVLYLDFWASWCGPCRGEMPYSLDLQKHFAGKDVSFVYISSDAGFEEWEAMIKVLQITGDHFRVTRKVKKEYNDLFNVRYIPRYIIYDREGNVVDSTAVRPSDPKAKEELEKLL